MLCHGSDGSISGMDDCPISCALVSTEGECSVPECKKCNYKPNTWSQCSVTCGKGVRSRSLDCICNDSFAADPAECDELGAWKPALQEDCFEQACPAPSRTPSPALSGRQCSYRANPWLGCSVTCGSGTRTRTLDCLCDTDVAAAPVECAAAFKPAEQEPCSEGQCPSPLTGLAYFFSLSMTSCLLMLP